MAPEIKNDLVHRYVQFLFHHYRLDPYGWVTKDPPSLALYEAMEIIETPLEDL